MTDHTAASTLASDPALVEQWRRNIRSDTMGRYHYWMGVALQHKEHQLAEAIAAYRRCLDLLPHMAECRFRLAEALRQASQPDAAEALEREAGLPLPAFRAEALFQIACESLGGPDDERDALPILRQACAADPGHGAAHLYAHILSAAPCQPWPEEPDGWTLTAIQADEAVRLCRLLARRMREAGDYPGAVRALSLAERILPGDPDILVGLAASRISANDISQAIDALERALSVRNAWVPALRQLAQARLLAGQTEQAEAHLLQAASLSSMSAGLAAELGVVRQAAGRLDEARAAFDQALSLAQAPGDRSWILSYSSLQRLCAGDLARAEQEAEQAVAAAAGLGWAGKAPTYLGLVRHAQGEMEQAEALHRQTLAQYPGEAFAHDNLAILLQALGRTAEAVAAHGDGMAVQPAWVPHNDRLRPDWARAIYRQIAGGHTAG